MRLLSKWQYFSFSGGIFYRISFIEYVNTSHEICIRFVLFCTDNILSLWIYVNVHYSPIFFNEKKNCESDNFVITGGTVSCRNGDLWCHQWRQVTKSTIFCFQCLALGQSCDNSSSNGMIAPEPCKVHIEGYPWNGNVIILMKFSSLAALEVVIFDNFQCSQWWKFHQNDIISISVISVKLAGWYQITTKQNKTWTMCISLKVVFIFFITNYYLCCCTWCLKPPSCKIIFRKSRLSFTFHITSGRSHET